MPRLARAILLVAVGLTMVSCVGNSGTTVIEGNYLVCGITVTPGGITGYATGVDNLGTDQSIDLSTALPLPGGAACVPYGDAIYVTDMEAPVVIRFDLTADKELVEAGRINFSGEGVTTISPSPNRIKFVSDEKAYLVDSDTAQVIVWNPTTMEITTTVELTGFAPLVETQSMFITVVVLRGDELVLVSVYSLPDYNLADLRLGILDTRTDTFEVTSTSDRCGGLGHFGYATFDDGSIYMASNSYSAGAHLVGTDGAFAPCFLRILPESHAFDDDYYVSLPELTGYTMGADIAPGPGNSAFTLVYDEDAAPLPDPPSALDVSNAEGWRLVRIDDITSSSPTVSLVDGLEPTSGLVPSYVLDGRTYFGSIGLLYSSTTLYDVTDDGEAVQAATFPGYASLILPLE